MRRRKRTPGTGEDTDRLKKTEKNDVNAVQWRQGCVSSFRAHVGRRKVNVYSFVDVINLHTKYFDSIMWTRVPFQAYLGARETGPLKQYYVFLMCH